MFVISILCVINISFVKVKLLQGVFKMLKLIILSLNCLLNFIDLVVKFF